MIARHYSIRTFFLTVALLAGAVLALPVQGADSLLATGDSQNLWIIRPAVTGEKFTILHRKVSDQPESKLSTATELRGRLIKDGIVAADGQIWLFYQDSTVQSIRVLEDAVGRRGYTDIILPSLPKGINVRSIAVTRTGGWVLARIEDQRLLDALDHPSADERTLRERRRDAQEARIKLKEQTDSENAKDAAKDVTSKDDAKAAVEPPIESTAKSDEKDPPVVAPAPTAIKADRLLHLVRDRWEVVELPADWNVNLPATLVTPSFEDPRPMLVVNSTPSATDASAAPAPAKKTVRWYSWEKPVGTTPATQPPAAEPLPQWIASEQTIEQTGSMLATTIDRQLVVMHRLSTEGKIEWAVTSIRTERVSELGTLSLDDRGGDWALTASGDQLCLITDDEAGQLQLRRINLRGVADANPIPMAAAPPSLGPVADLLVFVIVLALVTPVLILMWKRDPAGQPIALPRGVRVADLLPRALAASIDLFPCLYLSTLITGVSMEQMVDFWPGKSGGWEPMIPGAIAMGLFITSTFLTELFTARTMGKALIGMRVTGLKGEPPDIWQVLARNLFKALDLIAMPLLIFAIISPNRQRLGDVVGRTVVVMPTSPTDGQKQASPRGNLRNDEDKDDDQDGSDPPPDPRPKRSK